MSQREEEREEKRTRWGEKQKTIDKIIKKRMEMKEKEAVFKKYFIFFVIVL